MKLTTALIFLCLALSALAQDRAVLLVSLKGKTGLFRKDIGQKVVAQFKKNYNHSLPLVVIPNATQDDLFRETRNPDNKALFWISHANSFGDQGGLEQEDMILDVEGTNIKDILQKVHPNLNLLAVMGCKALPILQKNSYHQNLTVVSFDKKVSSKRAIRESLRALENVSFIPGDCPSEEGFSVTIKRKIQNAQEAVSVKVMNRGKLLGLFPKPSNEGTQTLTVYLKEAKSAGDLKLIFDSGKRDIQKSFELGTFKIETAARGSWSVFSDQAGNPMGVSQHIYRYRGEIPARLESFAPFSCR